MCKAVPFEFIPVFDRSASCWEHVGDDGVTVAVGCRHTALSRQTSSESMRGRSGLGSWRNRVVSSDEKMENCQFRTQNLFDAFWSAAKQVSISSLDSPAVDGRFRPVRDAVPSGRGDLVQLPSD